MCHIENYWSQVTVRSFSELCAEDNKAFSVFHDLFVAHVVHHSLRPFIQAAFIHRIVS